MFLGIAVVVAGVAEDVEGDVVGEGFGGEEVSVGYVECSVKWT